jgi:hypothetical protein
MHLRGRSHWEQACRLIRTVRFCAEFAVRFPGSEIRFENMGGVGYVASGQA